MSFGFLAALSRRRVLGGAGALVLLPAAGARAEGSIARPAAAPIDEPPGLHMQLVLEIHAAVGAPVQIGPGALGLRRHLPIVGGTFSGPRLSGVVLPGGADSQLERPDGITAVDARFELQADDGTRLSVSHHGIVAQSPSRSPPDSRVRIVPEIEAPAGAHDWLNRCVLVGSLDASEIRQGHVLVRVFRVT